MRAVGAKIRAKLLDSLLPFSKTGKTYYALHGIICASKAILQNLGLAYKEKYTIFGDDDNWEEQTRNQVLGSEI